MKRKDWLQPGTPLRKPWRTLPGADISPTKLASKASRNLALEYRLRKPRTAARFGPKPCETATTKTLETSLTKPIKKKNETKRLAPARNTFAKTFAHASRSRHIAHKRLDLGVLPAKANSLPQKRLDLGVLPAKASNSSKIRAQAMRNRHHKNSRNVAYETYEKERKMNERKRLAPARKTLAHASRSRHIAYKACLKSVSKSGLGVPPAKASNSSKIRAQKEK